MWQQWNWHMVRNQPIFVEQSGSSLATLEPLGKVCRIKRSAYPEPHFSFLSSDYAPDYCDQESHPQGLTQSQWPLLPLLCPSNSRLGHQYATTLGRRGGLTADVWGESVWILDVRPWVPIHLWARPLTILGRTSERRAWKLEFISTGQCILAGYKNLSPGQTGCYKDISVKVGG